MKKILIFTLILSLSILISPSIKAFDENNLQDIKNYGMGDFEIEIYPNFLSLNNEPNLLNPVDNKFKSQQSFKIKYDNGANMILTPVTSIDNSVAYSVKGEDQCGNLIKPFNFRLKEKDGMQILSVFDEKGGFEIDLANKEILKVWGERSNYSLDFEGVNWEMFGLCMADMTLSGLVSTCYQACMLCISGPVSCIPCATCAGTIAGYCLLTSIEIEF